MVGGNPHDEGGDGREGTALPIVELLRIARVQPVEVGALTRLRPGGLDSFRTFVTTTVMASYWLIVAYPILACVLGPRPFPVNLAVWVVAGSITGATLRALGRQARLQTGREDLVLNEYDGTLTLPWTFGRATDTVIDLRQIRDVAPARELRALRAGPLPTVGAMSYQTIEAEPTDLTRHDGHRGHVDYVVLVCWRDHDGNDIVSPVGRWTEPRAPIAFSLWLRRRLALDRDGHGLRRQLAAAARSRSRSPAQASTRKDRVALVP